LNLRGSCREGKQIGKTISLPLKTTELEENETGTKKKEVSLAEAQRAQSI